MDNRTDNIAVSEKSTKKDKKEKKGKSTKFTVIDALIIATVLLCIVGLWFRADIAGLFTRIGEDDSVKISFRIDSLSEEEVALIKKGDSLKYGKTAFGKLLDFTPVNTVLEKQTTAEGSDAYETVNDPESYTVYCTAVVSGKYISGSGFCLNGRYQLSVGKILNISSSLYTVTVIITEIPRK